MTSTLPRFIVLRSNSGNEYMDFIHENGDLDGYLQFSSKTQAVSPYAKFAVESATGAGNDGLVHIRNCENNKYWERTQNLSISENSEEQYWITATAKKHEEDQSKESCTLFKTISVDSAMNTFQIVHVQSGCYLRLRELSDKHPVLANYKESDENSRDIFTIIDWESLLILPKYVAFKGDKGKYLCLRWVEYHPYLQFDADDIGDSTVPCEIFVVRDGNIRIKPICSEKFWRLSPNWIWADSDDGANAVNIPVDTLFRPVKVDDQTIALINLANNRFCMRLTIEGKSDCLNAAVPSITKKTRLTVEEPVLTRKIYNFKYKLDNSRIYDERVLVAAKNSASNYTQNETNFDVTLSYTETKNSTWNTNFSLKFGAKATFKVELPLIYEGGIELSGEVQSGVQWGETITSTTVVQVVHKVVVPAMTKVTVDLIATIGRCDVPFSFIQSDTLYDGSRVLREVQGGTYTGSNFYNINFETKEEKLE